MTDENQVVDAYKHPAHYLPEVTDEGEFNDVKLAICVCDGGVLLHIVHGDNALRILTESARVVANSQGREIFIPFHKNNVGKLWNWLLRSAQESTKGQPMTETFCIDDENATDWLLRNMSECDALTETGAARKRHLLERFGAELEAFARELEYDLARKQGGTQ